MAHNHKEGGGETTAEYNFEQLKVKENVPGSKAVNLKYF